MHFASDYKSNYDPYLTLPLDQFQIIGRCVSGVESILAIPQFNLCLDAGRAPDFAFSQDYLALTHWHLDHAGGLAFYLGLRHLNSLGVLKIIMPEEKIEEAGEYLSILKTLSESELKYEIVAAKGTIKLKNRIALKAIPVFHPIASCGYMIEMKKHHLKDEFRGKPEQAIIEAKKAGVQVDQEVIEATLTFSGDTKAEFFETEAIRAKYLIMECSFFGDGSNYEKIRAYGHTHIIDWQRYADRIECEKVIMIHTSQRYSKKDIEVSCRRYLPKELIERLIVFR